VPALAGVDLDLVPGECLLVLGPSGSGKTTLALALAGLLDVRAGGRPSGEVAVGGPVGVVFQRPGDQVVMERVEDDVAFGLERVGRPREAMRREVSSALAGVGLAGFERRRSMTLSGGEQQRLALAGAIAPAPPILVLDEPTANLDPSGARTFIDRLASLRANRTTIVLVEHRVELAWKLADRVLVLGPDGRPVALGTPDAVVSSVGPALVAAGIWLPPEIDARLGVVAPSPLPAEEATGSAVVTAEGASYAYGDAPPAVDDVSVVVRAGERVALVGPNGGGKSTLGRLLVGLLRPSTGRVRLGGDRPDRLSAAALARRAGYLFQDPEQQFLAGTVLDEVLLGLRPDERARADPLMDALGLPLDRFAARSPYALSGGEQRRLSLACVLIRRPGLLILDEPTYGQDRTTYRGLLDALHAHLGTGTAVIVATHDERLMADLGGRCLRMEGGAVEAVA
jgi:energy-coupling factor transport system ATP-binding protein